LMQKAKCLQPLQEKILKNLSLKKRLHNFTLRILLNNLFLSTNWDEVYQR
jgi:hypothetical protein